MSHASSPNRTKSIEVISASAGSGKTYRLVREIADEIKKGLDPQNLIAVTYTKKAAEELKERIHQQLIEDGCLQAARQLPIAKIGTVHSVCAEFIRQFGYEFGKSPNLRVLDEAESESIFSMSFSEALDVNTVKSIQSLAGRFSKKYDELLCDFKSIAFAIVQNGLDDKQILLSQKESNALVKEVFGRVAPINHQAKLAKALENYSNLHRVAPDSTLKSKNAHAFVFECCLKSNSQNKTLAWSDWVKLSKLSPSIKSREHFSEVIDCANQYQTCTNLHADLGSMIGFGYELAQKSLKIYADKKMSLGLLDFGDLERDMLGLLNRQDVVYMLKGEVEVLFVDEFQDTNPMQLELYAHLSDLARRTVWVGDIKQSIYRFRGADADLMTSVIQHLSNGVADILKDNWRSAPELCDFVGDLFSSAFKADGIQSKYIRQNSKWKFERTGAVLEVWKTQGNKELRTRSLAHGVQDLLHENVAVRDRDTDQERLLVPADVAILCRTNEECTELSQELSALNIENSVQGGFLLSQPEVSLGLACFRYLINERDSIAAAEICLGFGKSPDEWLSLSLDKNINISDWSQQLKKIDQIRAEVFEKSIVEKLDLAISVVSLESWVQKMNFAERRLLNLSALKQQVRGYEKFCFAEMSPCTDIGFLEHLEKTQPALPAMNHSGAVNILTYHGAKGLEWPIVILSSLEQKRRIEDVFGVHVRQRRGTSFDPYRPLSCRGVMYLPWPFGQISDVPNIANSLRKIPESMQIQQQTDSELRRLLYVGMTRPRERLILVNGFGDRMRLEESFLGSLGPDTIDFDLENERLVINGNEHACNVRYLEKIEQPCDPTNVIQLRSRLALPDQYQAPKAAQDLYMAPSSLTGKNGSKFIVPMIQGKSIFWGRDLLGLVQGRKAIVDFESDKVGSAVHLFLGSDDFTKDTGLRHRRAERIIQDWSLERILDANRLISAADRFYKEIEKLSAHGELFREVPMLLEYEGSLIRGMIDCLILDNKKIMLIDHKATEATGDEIQRTIDQYGIQLAAYREAIVNQYPAHQVDVWLHNPNGWMVQVLFDGAEARGRVKEGGLFNL